MAEVRWKLAVGRTWRQKLETARAAGVATRE